MKHEVKVRIVVIDPPPGVAMEVQRGKDELLAPTEKTPEKLVFDFLLTVDLTETQPNFLGKFAQGPRNQRFIYVNSGTYAGEHHSCWGRRAKISLMKVTREQVEEAIAKGGALEAAIIGTGRDGGPTCASVPTIGGWRVV